MDRCARRRADDDRSSGELTLERLSEESASSEAARPSYVFVDEPRGRGEFLRWLRIPRERLSASGRFTTTGVTALALLFGNLRNARRG